MNHATTPADSPAATLATSPADTPDLSLYRDLHDAMRCANEHLVIGIGALPSGDTDRAAALGTWFAGYAGELRAHHHVEDTIFFPAIRDRVASDAWPADQLVGDHHELDRIIDELTASLRSLGRASSSWPTISGRALDLAVELRALLAVHLDVEDDVVLPLLESRFTAAEYDALDHRAIKTVPLRQLVFTVPWMMATLRPDAAERLRAGARLPMRVLWRTTRRRYARLLEQAFGNSLDRVE